MSEKLALGAIALLAVAGVASRKGSRSSALRWVDVSPTGEYNPGLSGGSTIVRWKAITHHGTYVFTRNRPSNFGHLRYEYTVPVLGLDEVVDGVHSSDLEHYPVFHWWGGIDRWMHEEAEMLGIASDTDWDGNKEDRLIRFWKAQKIASAHHLERRGIRGSRDETVKRTRRDKRVKLFTQREAKDLARSFQRSLARNRSYYENQRVRLRLFFPNAQLRIDELYRLIIAKYFAPEMRYWKSGQAPSIRGVPTYWPSGSNRPLQGWDLGSGSEHYSLQTVFSLFAKERIDQKNGDLWYDDVLRKDSLYLELNDLRGAVAALSPMEYDLKRTLESMPLGRVGSLAKGGWMTLAQVLNAEPEAKLRKVSSVARSKRGFVRAYEKARTKGKLGTMSDPKFGQNWHERRDSFIARHMAQLPSDSNSSGWKPDGSPTNRHLGLMMWAYTPTPAKTKEWLQSRGSRAVGGRSLLKWSPGGTLARETPTLGTPLELTAQKTRPHHGTYVWVPYRLTPRSERVHGRGRGNLRYEPEQGRHIGEQYFFCVSGWELDRSDKWSDVAQWDDDTTCTKHLTFEAAQKIADEHHLHHRGIRGIRGSRSKRFFQVNSPAQGLKVIKDKAITDNWKKSLRVRRKHPVAVLLPCAGTKPFPESPSHKHGYLEALDGLGVDLYVVSEPLGVVPYAWSRTWPNDSYDFPPKHLKGEARALLVDRIGEWFDKVGSKYPTVVSALPLHHSKLVRDANDGGIALVDASMTACRNGSCSDRSFRATSDEYKKWLRRKVKQYV